MACENLSNYYQIVMKFSGYTSSYRRTRALLILDPIREPVYKII